MKSLLSSRGLFIMGFVLLIASNIFVLTGVALNRSGDPDALVELTERELKLPAYIPRENSGVSLRLEWRVLGDAVENEYGYYGHWTHPQWFTADKLAELGVDVKAFENFRKDFDAYKEPIAKEVFIVLENNSALHTIAIERARNAYEKAEEQSANRPDDKNLAEKAERIKEQYEREQIERSRLFAVDAGLDPETLRKKYADTAKYIISKGLIKPSRTYKKGNEKVVGHISNLSIENIHVPLDHRKIFDEMMAEKKARMDTITPPRYSVQLAYGGRLEPWIVSVNKFRRMQIDLNKLKKTPEPEELDDQTETGPDAESPPEVVDPEQDT